MDSICACGARVWCCYYNGYAACTNCGLLSAGMTYSEGEYAPFAPLMPRQLYTRQRRFKKYLQRASRNQSANTIPEETWRYLIDHGPYNDSKAILHTLKRSKLKRKCYDSLPIMTHSLCENLACPLLDIVEQDEAMRLFKTIDDAITGPFISYVYALEYILAIMGRSDLLPFINKIQCLKRRAAYKIMLDKLFKSDGIPEVSGFERYGFCSRRPG